ncbi:MAG: dihydrofolate reductase family protein [Heyndrickxia sp.]
MRKVVLYIATSLDGYIAGVDDSLDWLFRVEGEGDNGYSEFYETVDTIIMGRKTYEQILILENGNFPYKNKQCYVFSQSITGSNENVEFVKRDIVSFINELKEQDGKNIWMEGGGELLHFFLKEKLVDEIRVTIAPSIIGKGIPLFKEGNYEMDLLLKGMKKYNQFVELQYNVK